MKLLIGLSIAFVTSITLAAPAKRTTSSAPAGTTLTGQKTISPSLKADLKGLSLYVSYDMNDSLSFEGNSQNRSLNGHYNGEKAIGVGGEYNFYQMENGVNFSVGGSYEMNRVQSSIRTNQQQINGALQSKPEVQFWTMYAQARAFLTSRLGVYGGANYNIPQIKNVPNGSWKGKIGYQFGATFLATAKFAVDGEYRTINFSGSTSENNVTTTFDNIQNQGLVFRGRYLF